MRTRTPFPYLAAGLLLVSSACGTMLPDRVFYPTDMKDPKKEMKAETVAPAEPKATPAETKEPVQTAQAESPVDSRDEVVFGSSPAPKPEETAAQPPSRQGEQSLEKPATEPAEQGKGQKAPVEKFFIPRPLPGQKTAPAEPVDARPSDMAPNAISHVFQTDYERAWNKALEAVLILPIISTDKASGMIITDWVMDDPTAGSNAGPGFLGGGGSGRTIKFKYIVKVADKYGDAEVTVIPYIQFFQERIWVAGTPKPMVAETLMKRIITKLEK